jgi:chloramphenicol-sensitive protein RarD
VTTASAVSPARAAEERTAILAGALCYLFWGFLPLLFKAAAWAGAGAWEIVAWRTLWSLPAAALLIWTTRSWGAMGRILATPRTLGWLALSALLIGINWSTFVWAVNHGHTLDASLGYYLNPLLSVAAGLLLFRERVGSAGWVAIALAAAGVALQTLAHGSLPLAALTMAVTFCLYGVIRKRVAAEAQTGLFVECLVLLVPAAAYAVWAQARGVSHAGQPLAALLLFLGGPATVIPLATFAWAARRMPLSTLGFLQFIAPTMQFAIGVGSGEPLPPLSLLAFAFIWSGVAVYAATAWRKARRAGLG